MVRNAAAVITIVCASDAVVMPRGALAQCDYSLTTYPSSELLGSGVVDAMTVFDDGSGAGPALIVGGWELLPVPGQPASDTYNIARWTLKDGWTPMAQPNELYFTRDFEVFDGDLYALDASGPKRWSIRPTRREPGPWRFVCDFESPGRSRGAPRA
jgi:hypothetical protein